MSNPVVHDHDPESPVVYAIREYVIPTLVFIAMIRFLWKNAFKPIFVDGAIWEFRRVPTGGTAQQQQDRSE